MPQDAFTINAIAKELDCLLKESKVNKVNQPNKDEVVLHLYRDKKTYKLLLSAFAVLSRASIIKEEKENPLTAFGFCMLLRKHLNQAVIEKIESEKYERIIKIFFTTKNELLYNYNVVLHVEIMGKYSNIILTENGKVLGSLKAFNLGENSLRPILTGMKYILPVKQDKFYPDEVGYADKLIKELKENPNLNLGEFIFNFVIGVSKQTAEEIAFLFEEKYGKITDKNAKNIEDFTKNFFEITKFSPTVSVNKNGEAKDFFALNYKSQNLEKIHFESLLKAQSEYYEKIEKDRVFSDEKRKLLGAIKKVSDKHKKREKLLNEKRADSVGLEADKIKGELIISNLYLIKGGEEKVTLKNYYDEYKDITISLDKNLSPSKNAENYFKRYNKKKRTLEAVEKQLDELNAEFNYVNSLISFISSAETVNELREVEKELKAVGLIKSQENKRNKKVKEKTNFLTYKIDNFTVKIGKNNLQNDELVKEAEGKDLWFHLKNYHSSHAVIETKGQEVSEKIKLIVAEICAFYSEAKNGGKVEVDYTYKKFVKKPQGAKPGFVNYQNQKTLVVFANKHEEFQTK